MNNISCAAIVGVGLIGGSMGRAMLSRRLADEVVGIDVNPVVLETALSLEAITRGTTSLAEGLQDAQLVVMATPVGTALQVLAQLSPFLKPGTVVTDVGSTKGQIVARAGETLADGIYFIGGHPMTGSEKGGVGALNEHLFENAVYVLTTNEKSNDTALELVTQLVKGLGALPLVLDAGEHDLLAATISHLPHLAASALVATVAGKMDYRNELLTLASGGFRDTTRVAMGNPEMWKDICLTNTNNIILLLDEYIRELSRLRNLVIRRDSAELLAGFRDAREFRLQLPYHSKGILPPMFNLYVYVPDQPGIIGEVANRLGTAGLNIAEIELLRIREEEGGPLRLGFLSEESRSQAAALLCEEGFRAEIQEG